MDDENDQDAEARLEGRREAEAFEAALRREEDRERNERLARLAAGEEDGPGAAGGFDAAPTEVARLRRQVEALAEFRSAVLRSKAWKLIQSLRRLVGRDW